MAGILRPLGRGLLAPGFAALLLAVSAGAAATDDLPHDPDALLRVISTAIEAHDYETLERLVLWKGAGEIKKRIVRFELNRNLGRPIKSITIEPFPEGGMEGVLATGQLEPNMEITHQVRVIFDEPPIEATGKLPTSVFLVGLRDEGFRIGLVNRTGTDDDDD